MVARPTTTADRASPLGGASDAGGSGGGSVAGALGTGGLIRAGAAYHRTHVKKTVATPGAGHFTLWRSRGCNACSWRTGVAGDRGGRGRRPLYHVTTTHQTEAQNDFGLLVDTYQIEILRRLTGDAETAPRSVSGYVSTRVQGVLPVAVESEPPSLAVSHCHESVPQPSSQRAARSRGSARRGNSEPGTFAGGDPRACDGRRHTASGDRVTAGASACRVHSATVARVQVQRG